MLTDGASAGVVALYNYNACGRTAEDVCKYVQHSGLGLPVGPSASVRSVSGVIGLSKSK